MKSIKSLDELKNIPVELYKQLYIPDHIKLKLTILEIIKENELSDINSILLEIFNKTKKIIKREAIWRILSDMKKLNMVETSSKGIYKVKNKEVKK